MSSLRIGDLDHAPCGFLIFSDSGTIKSVNNTLINLLGFEAKTDIEGHSIESLFTLATRIFYQTHFFPLLSLHGVANEIFLSLKKRDGDSLPVMCNSVRRDEGGQYLNHCVFIPVKERGKYEEQILKAKREAEEALKENKDLVQVKKDLESYSIALDQRINQVAQINDDIIQFSKIATHDLQEPIRKIAVWADIIIMKGKESLSERMLKDLAGIHRECAKLRDLTVNLEKFISLSIDTEDISMTNLSKSIERGFANAVGQGERLKVDLVMEPIPVVEGYASQMELLFEHLFKNFIRFSDHSRRLTISVNHYIAKSNSYLSIKEKFRYIDMLNIVLSDNGGLAEKSHDYVLLLNSRSTIKSIDIDFGFASCRKIANNHNGSITAAVDDQNVTKILLSLPFQQPLRLF